MSLQSHDQERAESLRQDGLLVGIAAVSILNGMHFSPLFDPFFILVKPFAPAFFITSPLLLFYFTSLLLSAGTLVLAGVPSAIFERVTGRKKSDSTSLAIWLACTIVLVLPTLTKMGA